MIQHEAAQGLPLVNALVLVSGIIPVVGALRIVLGYKAWVGAWLIVVFSTAEIFMMHQFWALRGSARQES